MKTVFKYVIADTRHWVIMPKGAEIVHAHEQRGQVCIWAVAESVEVGSEASDGCEIREFVTVGTGNAEVPDGARYIGTAHLQGGALVLHVFEIVKTPIPV